MAAQDTQKREEKHQNFFCMISGGRNVVFKAVMGLFLGIVKAQMDLASEIFKADISVKNGDLIKAESIYNTISQHFRDNSAFRKKYAEFLMSRGEYSEVIKRFEKDPEIKEKTKRASECLSILISNNVRLIATLIKESPYSKAVLEAYIQVCLIDEKLEEAEKFVKKSMSLFPNESAFLRQEMQLYFLRGMFSTGIKMLNNLKYKEIASLFASILEDYERIKKSNLSSKDKCKTLDRLVRTISLAESDSNFFPSIFSTLKLNVIFDLCKSGVEGGMQGLTSRAQYLHSKRNNDDTMYLYTMALTLDGNIEEAEEKFRLFKFRNTKLRNHISHRLEVAKEEREKKRREKEEKRHRRQQYMEENYGGIPRNKGDFLGYYKMLGFKEDEKPDEKEIKKAYRKIVVKNKKKKKNENEEKEWEENFKKINKAFGVLGDKKKRDMYDKGIDPDNPQQPSPGFGNDPFQEIFKGFGNFRFFDFPNQGRRGRRSTTTYFYF
ncbi:DnaJ domain-containing protein [Encephalitozoon hellem]|uniref:DnaJ domain-containing protein n=1 Tax=Encephalitozoon hellem TaxID=27973 RepID=A0ABY8CMY0_ENCHE|nr:DnaJ domain-containing protein [Encephalitozoon hellem]